MSVSTIVAHAGVTAAAGAVHEVTRPLSTVASAVVGMEVPSVSEIFHLAVRGWISEYDAQDLLLWHGIVADWDHNVSPLYGQGSTDITRNAWDQVFYAAQHFGTVQEYFEISNRNLISDPAVSDGLRKYGFYDKSFRDDFTNLRYDIPGPSDLVRFSVRHVFEPDLIAKLGYDAEYNKALDVWHQFQGLNYEIWTDKLKAQVNKWEVSHGLQPGYFAGLYAQYSVPEPTWARAYWWSHWVLPSPTFGYLALQRLRPTRDPVYDAPEALGQTFDMADMDLLLRANDYPPKYRGMMAALSRPIPGVRFARDFRKTGVYDFPKLLEWAHRQGYASQDAFDIASSIDLWAQQSAKAKTTGRGKSQIVEAYCLGVLDQAAAEAQLEAWGMTPQDAALEISIADLECKIKRVRKVVASIRRQFLSGAITQNQVSVLLGQYGINGNAIAQYIFDWTVELTSSLKQVSAQKNVQWACKGIITVVDLQFRLQNLGYDNNSVAGLVAEAQLCIAGLQAKAAAAQAEATAKATKAQIAAQKAAQQQLLQARRQLASHGSPTQLRKWFCEGLIGQPELASRLQFLGWPSADIVRLISDCGKKPGP